MLRITVVSETSQEVILRIEGRVTQTDLGLVREEITRCSQEAKRVVIDLANVRFIDDAGIELLTDYTRRGMVLSGGSPFLRSLLEGRGL